MASIWFNSGKEEIANNGIAGKTFKAMLVDSSYTPDPDDDFVADGAGDAELAGTGYVGGFDGAGRLELAVTIERDDATDRAKLVCDPVTWTALQADNGTIARVIIIEEGTTDADSQMYLALDPTDLPCNGSDVTFTPHADGIGYI